MSTGSVALMLLYEPAAATGRPVPLARITSHQLAIEAAKAAITEAQLKADSLAKHDEILGEVEQAEVKRLYRVLSILIPELAVNAAALELVQ
jgi:hypothetical protein